MIPTSKMHSYRICSKVFALLIFVLAPVSSRAQEAAAVNLPFQLSLVLTLKSDSSRVSFATFSPNGKKIITANWDGTVSVWDALSGNLLLNFASHKSAVLFAGFSPDNSRIVTTGRDGIASVWDASSGKILTSYTGHHDWIRSAAFSPDGSRIVTASDDKTAQVWDASRGLHLLTLTGHSEGVRSAQFDRDNKKILTAAGDGTAKVWDALSGKLLNTLSGHPFGVLSATFSPDGSKIATASWDGTAKVWDAATGMVQITLSGHKDVINSVSFSPDGSRIVTASGDRTAKVWDAINGAILANITDDQGKVVSAVFSPDGSRIVTVNWQYVAKVWDASSLQTTAKLLLSNKQSGIRLYEGVKVVGVLPLELNTLMPGKHTFTLELPGYQTQTLEVDVKAGETLTREITLLPALGVLSLTSSPPGAQVAVAGKILGITPLKLENQPIGKQDYTLTLPKYKPIVRSLEVLSGAVREQSVTFERLPTVLELRLDSEINTAVFNLEGKVNRFVNGKATLELDPDKTSAEVKVSAPGYTSFVETVKLEPSGQTVLNIKLELRGAVKIPSVQGIPLPTPLPVKPSLPNPPVPSSSVPLPSLPPRSDVYALVMGVSQYSLDTVSPLEYAASDAQSFLKVLTDPLGANVPSRNVISLINQDARRRRIENALKGFGKLRSSDTLIVYFSGHGTTSQEGRPLLAPFEADPLNVQSLQESSLALEDLEQQARATGAGHVVFILDACYSGTQDSKSLKAEGSKPIGIALSLPPLERVSVFSASSAKEPSYESKTLKAGYFTATLLEGLSGGADRNGDGKITLEELYAYTGGRVTQAVLRDRSATQTPELQGNADFALVVRPLAGPTPEYKLGQLRRDGKISVAQLDRMLELLERGQLPGDVADYLGGKLEEGKFLRRLNSGAIEGVSTP